MFKTVNYIEVSDISSMGNNGVYAHAVKKYTDRKVRIDNLNLE